MSFDHNPMRHIELIERDNGTVIVYCHGCGGERPRPDEPGLEPSTTTLFEVFRIAREHVRDSHKRTEADFEGWSIY